MSGCSSFRGRPLVQTLFQLQKHPCHGYTALRIHAPKSNRALLALGAVRRRADQIHAEDKETYTKALYKDDEAATLDDPARPSRRF